MEYIKKDDIKKIQIELLTNFADFCKENNIYYTLAYGTLIGAVRHKGFIPWDDDVDVVIPRPDYERFIELTNGHIIAPNIYVLSYKHKNCTYPFVKLIDNRTIVEEKFASDIKIGVWIDVFPVDGNFKNSFLNAVQYKSAWLVRKLIEIKRNDFASGTTKVKKLAKGVIYPFTKILSFDLLLKITDNICQLKNFEKSDIIGSIIWTDGIYERIDKNKFMKSIDVEFEGYVFNAPSNYDEYLHNVYGDYMQLPPANERIPHDFKAWWKDQ